MRVRVQPLLELIEHHEQLGGRRQAAALAQAGKRRAQRGVRPQAWAPLAQLPENERHLYPESYLKDSLAVRLGGRAAELLVLGEASTGASNDLAGATQLAVRMIREWGLSDRVGPIGYTSDGPGYLGDNGLTSRPYAETTQRAIDEEVARLLREAQERATSLLSSHRPELDRVVALLLEKETIDGSELQAVLQSGAAVVPSPSAPAAGT